ncbi:M23 family metallopeptidase [Frigidibacter sp. ROC022]|uniref:M23 family metallopeptidase n=1 Tax=Frigidibacter sp. ROC022 TaxID=2971796 RepID=UPI00215AE4ED|nr:M23 family metallopeptidase [Frigidibacter sp. ROC022]MCR8723555.1 M23 family metallopeptidase [Frigidibacter sp. ROC022]
MIAGFLHRIDAALSRAFPERRVFLRSDTETRFIRLTPATQLFSLAGSALVVGWAIIASAIILMDSIGSGNVREQARRDRLLYEQRLNELSAARDQRAEEAAMAQDRFNAALDQVSQMQSELLASEDRRKELEEGIEVVQATLRSAIRSRDEARAEALALAAKLQGAGSDGDPKVKIANYEATLDTIADALDKVAVERDRMAEAAADAEAESAQLLHEAKLVAEKNDRIFAQLEDAMSISLTPLDNMFKKAGMPTEKILETVRKGYSGQGGPLTPISLSTKGSVSGVEKEANAILDKLDRLNIYRIAVQKAPFGMPVKTAFRYTSGFGMRWGRMHEGTDLAGAYGAPIYATADGVVTHAGWSNGYGNLVKIQHEFGMETRYGHMSKIRVKVGQRVSRGDRIGDMGSTGRSTGTHLHYEVRIGGKAVNPMTYLKAGKDVL